MSLVALLERTARFFRLPVVSYDPAGELEREGPGTWPRLYAATWVMMAASLLATAEVTAQRWLALEMALLLVAAGPVAYRLHYRPTSRLLVNWLSFTAALVVGLGQLRFVWPMYGGVLATENFDAMAFLVVCFMWITVFRAFALRTVTDLVQTTLPCGSVILLVLLLKPVPLTLGCMAVSVLSILALLAAEYRVSARQAFHPVAALSRSRALRRTGSFYSWPTLYALVLLVAVLVAYTAARAELSGGWGEVVRIALARQVYRWIAPRDRSLISENTVLLHRLNSWPNGTLPVFKALTKQPGNWRTVVYHTYDGIRWMRGRMKNRRAVKAGDSYVVPLAGSGAAVASATRVEQVITAQKIMLATLPTLFTAVEVQVDLRSLRYDRDRVMHIPTWVRPGDSYKVISYTAPVVPMPRAGVDVPAAELAVDLELPASLPQRVRDLARQLAATARTPYEKARAIEQHLLWEGYEYSLEVPSSWPNDFVDHFLFTTKRGFCHHFAGSMVLMCRSIGLPARLAGGFLQGEEDKDNVDLYTVREKDAHVWPEVYFKGAGWVAFEPTPPEPEARRPLAEAWEAITKAVQTAAGSLWEASREQWPSVLALAVSVALLAAGWQAHRHHRLPRGFRQQPELARVVRSYLRLREALGRRGAAANPHLAPREWLAALPPHLQPVRPTALALTEKYLQQRFGGQPTTVEQAAATEALLLQTRIALKQLPARQRGRQGESGRNPGPAGDSKE